MIKPRTKAGRLGGTLLSVAFAAFLTTLYAAELLLPALQPPPVGQPTPVTIRTPFNGLFTDGNGVVQVRQRRVLLARGRPMTTEIRQTLDQIELGRRKNAFGPIAGYALGIFLGASLMAGLLRGSPPQGPLARTQVVLFALLALAVAAGKAFLLFLPYPAMWIPAATLPMLFAWIVDRRIGLSAAVMAAVAALLLTPVDLFMMVVVLVEGVVAVSFVQTGKRQGPVIVGGIVAGLAGALAYATLLLMAYGRIPYEELRPLESGLLAALAAGPLSSLLTLLLVRPVSALLAVVPRSHLLDMADMNSDLLKYIAERAPGTWQHSLAMANLAEAAANAVGANGLLTRVGAYYHDLGKTVQPEYYVENQRGGPNPHDELEPDVSADAIFSHVVEGVKIARRHHLPERITDFIHMHHGTSMLQFFWGKNLELGNPKGLTEDDFRYPGVKPQSKETAIIMICDAVEAASRTLGPNPERKAIDAALQRIIFEKLQTGQFDESGLTVPDLANVAKSLGDSLAGALHVRIKYPWQKEEEAKRAAQQSAGAGGAGGAGGPGGAHAEPAGPRAAQAARERPPGCPGPGPISAGRRAFRRRHRSSGPH